MLLMGFTLPPLLVPVLLVFVMLRLRLVSGSLFPVLDDEAGGVLVDRLAVTPTASSLTGIDGLVVVETSAVGDWDMVLVVSLLLQIR